MIIDNEILILSDTHGRHDQIIKICNTNKDKLVLQIGDFGIGFGRDWPSEINPIPNFKFIHGNHDNPERCKLYSGYLGRYGHFTWKGKKVFYISGAWSIDFMDRTPGKNWWHNEELSIDEMEECAKLYLKIKPDIVISHDAPDVVWEDLVKCGKMVFGNNKYPNRTSIFLSKIFSKHQPETWIFGHYHFNANFIMHNTKFNCLEIMKTELLSNLEKR